MFWEKLLNIVVVLQYYTLVHIDDIVNSLWQKSKNDSGFVRGI